MDTVAVFVNDAGYARQLLEPMIGKSTELRWVLVACAPRLTHRIGKWSAHASREQWREKWCQRLFEQLQPLFAEQPADRLQTTIARSPLLDVVSALRGQFGDALHVMDARRPRLGAVDEPLSAGASPGERDRWAVPIAVSSGISMVLALSD